MSCSPPRGDSQAIEPYEYYIDRFPPGPWRNRMYKRDIARKKICSEQACFTAQMMRNGISFVNWFTDMIALAIEGQSGYDDDLMKIRFIRHKMHVEVRELSPPLRDDHTLYSYLHEVRNAEDSIRTVILAESPDDIVFNEWRNLPRTFIMPWLRGQYPPPGIYIPERLRGQKLYLEGLPYHWSPKQPDRPPSDPPTETPGPAVTQTPEDPELVHDAERQDDTTMAKIDDKDEPQIVKETPDDAHHDQIGVSITGATDEDSGTPIDKARVGIGTTDDIDLVEETPDDAHHDQVDNNTTGAAHEDSSPPIDKVRVGIGTTDDSQLQKQCRHPMVLDRYRQNLTYIDEALFENHWRVQARIGIG